MATLSKALCKDLLESVLPTFGNPRIHVPVWDNSQKMFIFDEYESASGHRYYRGIRFCNRIAIVENVGLYHSWTYIDGIELYAFNGQKVELIQKMSYDKTFRDETFIRKECQRMVKDFLKGVCKAKRISVSADDVESQANEMIDGCYKSFLDSDYNTRLTQIIPAIEQK